MELIAAMVVVGLALPVYLADIGQYLAGWNAGADDVFQPSAACTFVLFFVCLIAFGSVCIQSGGTDYCGLST